MPSAVRNGDWRKRVHKIEQWLSRVHLFWWLASLWFLTAITAVVGYLAEALLYLLIPAALGTTAFTFSLIDRLRGLSGTRAPKLISGFSDICASIDVTDHHAKLGLIPARNIARLRILLDQSSFLEGVLGVGNVWAMPHRSVIADLRDIVRGVRQIVPLTQIGQRITGPPATTQYFLQWAGTTAPIAPSGLSRCRIALIVDDDPEEAYTFFAVSYPSVELDRPALRVIGQEQFPFLANWEVGAIARGVLSGPS